MSTKMTLRVESKSSEETEQIAESLGRHLKGGEVIELVSDLGGGKTTFTRGLVRGVGSSDHVSSPTFKVCNVYKSSKIEIHHFDFYRLGDARLIHHELADLLNEPDIVIVVEWADIVKDVLPKDTITVEIKHTNDSARELSFHYFDNLAYLFT